MTSITLTNPSAWHPLKIASQARARNVIDKAPAASAPKKRTPRAELEKIGSAITMKPMRVSTKFGAEMRECPVPFYEAAGYSSLAEFCTESQERELRESQQAAPTAARIERVVDVWGALTPKQSRSVPLEQVPDYVTKLPVDQFRHIVNVLRDVPREVQPAASAALNEIRSHFANSVEKAGNSTQGMWNTKAANEFLNKNQLRMAHVFSPEEMGRFKTLADAGHILRMDRTYPGSAAQGHNLAMRGVLNVGKLVGKAGFVDGVVASHGL